MSIIRDNSCQQFASRFVSRFVFKMKTVTIFKGRYPYKKIQIPRDDARGYFDQGRLASVEGNYEQAITFYKKALAIEPDYKQALINLKFVYWQMGKFKDTNIRANSCLDS